MLSNYLVTGANGFLGKVFLYFLALESASSESTLSVPGMASGVSSGTPAASIGRIFVLVRDKGARSARARFEAALERFPPEVLARFAAFRKKCRIVPARLTSPGLDLEPQDRSMLLRETTHLVHIADAVRFDVPLVVSARFTVGMGLHVLDLARFMPNLRHFVHVSTAYVWPGRPGSGGGVVRTPAPAPLALPPLGGRDPEDLYRTMQESAWDNQFFDYHEYGFANGHAFAKAVAEHLLWTRHRAGAMRFALSMLRPALLAGALRDPVPGWTDAQTAYSAYLSGFANGQVPGMLCEPAVRPNLVPVDFVAARLLATVQRVPDSADDKSPLVVYATASSAHLLKIQDLRNTAYDVFRHFPPRGYRYRPFIVRRAWLFRLLSFFLEALPRALYLRRLERTGQGPEARRLRRQEAPGAILNKELRGFFSQEFSFQDADPCRYGPARSGRLYHLLVNHGVTRYLLRTNQGVVTLGGRSYRGYRRTRRFIVPRVGFSLFFWLICLVAFPVYFRSFQAVHLNYEALIAALSQIPPGYQLVITPTHKSYFDFLLVYFLTYVRPELKMRALKTAATGKFRRMRLIALMMRYFGVFFIEREPKKKDIPILRRDIERVVKSGRPFMFFPEGRRSRTGAILPFKKGLFRLLSETGQPFAFLPIHIRYDKRADEAQLQDELHRGASRADPRGLFFRALGWLYRAMQGKIDLKRAALNVGPPVFLDASHPVSDVETHIMNSFRAMELENLDRASPVAGPARRGRLRSLRWSLKASGSRRSAASATSGEARPDKSDRRPDG